TVPASALASQREFRLRRGFTDARLESPDKAVVEHHAARLTLVRRERNRDVHICRYRVEPRARAWKYECRSHDTNHGVRTSIEQHTTPDDAGIAAESALP